MTLAEEFLQDIRYAVRTLRAAPGFTAVALLTLALGIGATTAIFSVVRGVLLQPPPVADAERIVRIWHVNLEQGIRDGAVSEPDFLDWREQTQAAEIVAGFWYHDQASGLDLTGAGDPERISAALVTDGFFETLGVGAGLGRTIHTDEHVDGRNQVVVLSHGFWHRRFGGDPAVTSRTVVLNDRVFQVVGVMPAGFTYPSAHGIDAWIPLSFFGPDDIGRARAARFLSVLARMKPGTSERQLRAELGLIATRLAERYPENVGWTEVSTAGIAQSLVRDVRRPLLVLMAAVALLLLMACVNIAGLLLARAAGRQPELAVRAALGAGRARVARQLVTESLTLSLLGGAAGALIGMAAVRIFSAAGAANLPRAAEIRVDWVVLAFALAASGAAGLLFGVAPALRASASLGSTLRGGRAVVGAGQRLRSALVVVEVALALVLLAGAGLAAKSFARLTAVDPGFDANGRLVATISVPPKYDSPEAMRGYSSRVLDAVRAIPGVEAAGSIRDLPLLGSGELTRPGVAGRVLAPGEEPAVQRHHVSTGYFEAMGIALRAGRTFTMEDRAGAPLVTVISEETARRVWPGDDPIGKAFRYGSTDVTVVGVVGDVRQRGLDEPFPPAMYLHVLQQFRSRMNIVMRTSGDPASYAGAVRRAIWAEEPTQTIPSVMTLESVVSEAVARPRLLAWLLAVFSAMGITLSLVGIFGLLSYSVAQRQQEIGLRVALGAPRSHVLGAVIRHGMQLAALGVVLGLAAAFLLTQFLQGVLYDIRPGDPATLAQVSALILLAALAACWVPARRALAVDPLTVLRHT